MARPNKKTRSMWKTTAFFVLLIYRAFFIVNATVEHHYEERSQRRIALLNHTYKSLYAQDYSSCLMSCMHDSRCKSFNYWWHTSKCDLNNRTKYSAEAKFLTWDFSTTYGGLAREPEINGTLYRSCRHVHPSNGDGEYWIDPTLSGNPSTVYCDMTTDGGGWTAIQMISNLYLQDGGNVLKILSSYRELKSTTLLQLRNELGFKQLRFYCRKKNVGTVLHIMTNLNPLGEAVVNYFVDDNLVSTRPQTCGSYTVLPDDNSTLSEDCTKLGWNGTHADGNWGSSRYSGKYRIQKPLLRYGDNHRLYLSPATSDCDDWEGGEASLSPGDTWSVFVR